MKINRLKINIENKIEILNESISMAERMFCGEKITVKGLNTMTFGKREDVSDSDYLKSLEKLVNERDSLRIKLSRFKN